MGGRDLMLEGQTRGNTDSLFSSLVEFCVDSVFTCFTHDAHKLCVPVALSSVSALLLLLSCFLLVYKRCRFRRENAGGTITVVYSLLGNLCSTVGAILSRQLHIQILMGAFAAALDAVHFVSCCFLVLLCWNSKSERKLRVMRGRRRQRILAVCVLMVVAGGFLKTKVTDHPAARPLSRRTLLHYPLQDNTELLGYTLGLLSFVIASTSRFPALCRAYRGQVFTQAHVLSGLLCSLAGAFYAAAILLYDTQFGFLLRVMPWLLSAICCVILDLLILVIHCFKRGTRQSLSSFSPDTESLLGGSGIPAEDDGFTKRQRKQPGHSSAQTKTKNVQQKTEMGRYMDVNVRPARKICLREVMLSKEEEEEEEEEDRPLNRTVRVIRVDSFCSSDTSSSFVSSDLEWDFEETNAQWNDPTTKQQEGDKFPLQEWTTKPKPFNICTCAMTGLSQKTLSAGEEDESFSSVSLSK